MDLLLLLASLSPTGHCTVVDTFGSGAAAIAMGGGGIALPIDSGSVFINPAGLTHLPANHEMMLGYTLSRTAFTSFPALWWDQNRDGVVDEEDEPLDYQPEYDATDGIILGTSQDLGSHLSVGMAAYMPKDRLLTLYTFEPDLPYYYMYASRLQRYALAGGLAMEPLPGMSFGLGFRMVPRAYYDIVVTMNASLVGAGDGDDSAIDLIDDIELDVHEMTLLLTPDIAPMLGLCWDLGQMSHVLHGLSVAATWRGTTGLPVEVTADIQVNVTADEIGDLGPILLPIVIGFGLGVYDHYLPEQLVIGLAYEPRPFIRGYADLRRTYWQAMALNITEVVDFQITSPLWDVDPEVAHGGNDYYVGWKNTWSFRSGLEYTSKPIPTGLGLDYLRFRLRGGVGIEPTPLVEQWASSALLDSDRWLVSGGLGIEHRDPFGLEGAVQWNGFAQYQALMPGTYRREEPDEITAGYPREASGSGWSEIPIGGHLWAAGLQVSLQY